MSYQVLARKWRPRSFATLVGQEHVVRALTHALTTGRIHHAYLLTGTRGVGKTTIARILAKALNCEAGMSANPCGQCTACQEVDGGRFVDLLEVDAANNTRVDEMRELLENAIYKPVRGRYKVYVIDEVHMLSNHAFNAMLKTLEEPPEHVIFILATTDPQKVPITILSRCLQFNLKQMPPAAIVKHLEHILSAEAIPCAVPALQLIAAAAEGSMRDALSILDQAIAHGSGQVDFDSVRDMLGTIDMTYLFNVIEHVLAEDAPALIALAETMLSRSLSFSTALKDLGRLLVNIQIAQFAPGALADEMMERQRILALAQHMSPEFVQLAYQIVNQGKEELSLAPDEFAGWIMTCLRLLAFSPMRSDNVTALSKPATPTTLLPVSTPPKNLVAPTTDSPKQVELTQPIQYIKPIESPLPTTQPVQSPPQIAAAESTPPISLATESVAQVTLPAQATQPAQVVPSMTASPSATATAFSQSQQAPEASNTAETGPISDAEADADAADDRAQKPAEPDHVGAEPDHVGETSPAAAEQNVNSTTKATQQTWLTAIKEMRLSAMPKNLVQHTVLLSLDETHCHLLLDRQQKHLLANKSVQDTVQSAIAKYFKRPIQLNITLGEPETATPAVLAQQAKQARLSAASAAIMADPTIQELQQSFDAQVLPDSIQPIAPDSAE